MKSFIAGTLALTFHTLGFALGCAIWAVIGWCLGSAFSHAPVSGALTGIAYQLGCYIWLHDQMWAGLQQSYQKLLVVLDRSFA